MVGLLLSGLSFALESLAAEQVPHLAAGPAEAAVA